jgi:SulP family sulfate permease
MNFSFKPALLDIRRNYSTERLVKDVAAGMTVGVVALPLAMAFAMASGLTPQAGLYTAIIAGFLISALGGSPVQIGGPAGAFIVIVYGIVSRYGVASLIVATAMSGVMLMFMGMFKLGSLIRFIPVAVIIGFTNGIAVLIALSQIKDLLGLQITNMPADFAGMLRALHEALPAWNPWALGLAALSLGIMVIWQKVSRRWSRGPISLVRSLSVMPGSVVALVLASLVHVAMDLPVDTLGSRFGEIPSTLPAWQWPEASLESLRVLLVPAATLALLGAIESLLCARVADGLARTRHDPNQELLAQGVANLVTPFMGGMPATGTIARTVVNVQSGATSPVAGMVHAATLLVVMLVAAPLASHVPLPTLAAILLFVAWNMGEWHEFARLKRYRLPYRLTLLTVFVLTVVVDLTVAVEVGLVAAALTFIYRIASLSRCESVPGSELPALAGHETQVGVFKLQGALFFGAVHLTEQLSHAPQRALVLDFSGVIYLDSSGVDTLRELIRHFKQDGRRIILCGLAHQPLDIAQRLGLNAAMLGEDWQSDLHQALASALRAP